MIQPRRYVTHAPAESNRRGRVLFQKRSETDVNRYTTRHTREYLQILLDSAQATGVKTAEKPFYDDTAALQRAAMARTVRDSSQPVKLPGLWNWIWDGDSH